MTNTLTTLLILQLLAAIAYLLWYENQHNNKMKLPRQENPINEKYIADLIVDAESNHILDGKEHDDCIEKVCEVSEVLENWCIFIKLAVHIALFKGEAYSIVIEIIDESILYKERISDIEIDWLKVKKLATVELNEKYEIIPYDKETALW